MGLPWEKDDPTVRSIEILRFIDGLQDAVTYADVVKKFYPPAKDENEKRKQNRDAAERLRRMAKWGMIDRIDWDTSQAAAARSRVEVKLNKKTRWAIGRHPAIYMITEKGLKYLKERIDGGTAGEPQ